MSEINTDFIQTKCGYCHFEIEEGKHPIIWNLYIHPQYRKQGHAKKLLQYVIKEIRDTGYIGEIDIEPDPREDSISYENLCKFYTDLGLNLIFRD
jgi:GNAT superfamily N-acetyltransferase